MVDEPGRDLSVILGELTRSGSSLQALLPLAVEAIGAQRVGLWRWDAAQQVLRLELSFDRDRGLIEEPIELPSLRYPSYIGGLQEGEQLAVGDVLADRRTCRFAEDKLVEEGIAALLDTPIHVQGQFRGVLCCGSATRRTWTEQDRALVRSIADLASLARESRARERVEATLADERALAQVAMESAGMAAWAWRVSEDLIRWERGVSALFGEPADWTPRNLDELLERVHPADRERVRAEVAHAVAHPEEDYVTEYRVWNAMGRWVHLHGKGRFRFEQDGVPVDTTRSESDRDASASRSTGSMSTYTSRSPTTDRAWRPRSSSVSSSPSSRRTPRPVPGGSGCRRATASCSGWAVTSPCAASSATAPRSRCACPAGRGLSRFPPRCPSSRSSRSRRSAPGSCSSRTRSCWRPLLQRVLEREGYRVEVALDVAGALEAAERLGDGLGVLVTDQRHPDGLGTELATVLAARLPNLGVVFMTGYTAEGFPEVGRSSTALMKPFRPSVLVAAVQSMKLSAP